MPWSDTTGSALASIRRGVLTEPSGLAFEGAQLPAEGVEVKNFTAKD
jgi:hypothetical protein